MPYPFSFLSQTHSVSGRHSVWTTQSPNGSNQVAVPPEFEGPGGALSPEDLYNQALTNCFVGTFKVLAENSKLEFDSISATSNLTVDLNFEHKPIMKAIRIRVTIHKPKDPQRAIFLARKAASAGFILNSVKTECHFDFLVD